MRAPHDDNDFVLANSCERRKIAAGDTSLDLMTCAIGQLSDDEIACMNRQELLDLMSLSGSDSVIAEIGDWKNAEMPVLQSFLRSERDRCREWS